jgi:hypothetical protein
MTIRWFVTLLALCSGCASVSWSTPVFYAGPTAAPIEEVSAKNPKPAVAAGWNETVGIGQYDWRDHEWDVFDVGLLELGGLALPGSNPSGMLQLGVKIGTLNGIIGGGILFDSVDSTSQGALQGGPLTPIFAGIFDVQAIVAFFGSSDSSDSEDQLKAVPRLPRGGM